MSLAVGLVALSPGLASAQNQQHLPFSDPYGTQKEGSIQIEQTLDASPVRVRSKQNPSEGEVAAEISLPTELNYGITDRLQLTDVLLLSQSASTDPSLALDGAGLRLQYRITEKNELPVDVAAWAQALAFFDGMGGEGRLILAKPIASITLTSNFWVRAEAHNVRDGYVASWNASLGADAELGKVVHLGGEGFVTDRFGNAEPKPDEEPEAEAFNPRPHVYLGPTISLAWKKVYWTTGAYVRLDELEREGKPGDQFGRFRVRSLLGFGI